MQQLPPPPPPVIAIHAPPTGQATEVIAFVPGTAACGGTALPAAGLRAPAPIVRTRYGTASATPAAWRFGFALDADGRPRGIRPDTAGGEPPFAAPDLAAALAASRFPAGAARGGCSMAWTTTVTGVEDAALPVLQELFVRRAGGVATAAIGRRIHPDASTCARGPGGFLTVNNPDFAAIRAAPGGLDWTMYAYDVTPAGRPTRPRVTGSTGNAALERAGLRALAGNRYAAGAGVTGCIQYFFKDGAPAAATVEPPPGTPVDNGELPGCGFDPASMATFASGRAFPPAFLRRGVAGVAVIGFDVAPWGAIGNVRVLASEPSDAFGIAAMNVVRTARVAESETGRRGCVRRIRFQLPPPAGAPPPPAPAEG